jgi:hypothetical protein
MTYHGAQSVEVAVMASSLRSDAQLIDDPLAPDVADSVR